MIPNILRTRHCRTGMAKAAKHPNAVAAHEELALRYDALIKG
jgi:hypothetical protein